jgi:hypothetical protein
MSKRYPGGLITKTPVTPTPSAAPGIWTLEQATQNIQAGTWPSSNPNYIEDVFSTYLYTGTGAAQTITNNINLSDNGGLVWMKGRSGATDHALYDTARGATFDLISNSAAAQTTQSTGLTSFGSTGFSIGALAKLNTNAATYVSWAFRKQPKFFDVVTYTGTGSNTTVAHNLGSVPGCIMVKCLNATQDWTVYHSGLTSPLFSLFLNLTAGQVGSTTFWNSTAPTSSVFSLGNNSAMNGAGNTYVAYLFASNAGGFGTSGNDNVITCGSFTTGGTGNATVTLGYEPQWVMIKNLASGTNWLMLDTMRGWSQTSFNDLYANSATNESSNAGNYLFPTATGFNTANNLLDPSSTYIYIAIRRGPMKVPTVGTSVFKPVAYTGTSVTRGITGVGFPLDMNLTMNRATHTYNVLSDRLRGLTCDGVGVQQPQLRTNATDAEALITNGINGTSSSAMDGYTLYNAYSQMNATPDTYVSYNFRRAPGFFDEVCYTGNGTSNTSISHNLTVIPELWIVKARNEGTRNWQVYYDFGASTYSRLVLNTTSAATTGLSYNSSTNLYAKPTASALILDFAFPNTSAETYVAYLFATVAGVSKVGSYTGTGATQTIDCGFTGGARFVLIKRTDSTGDWYVWDTARGMVSGTDPSLLLNSTAAEVNANSVYTTGVGFQIVSTAAGINASGGTYIFLAVA